MLLIQMTMAILDKPGSCSGVESDTRIPHQCFMTLKSKCCVFRCLEEVPRKRLPLIHENPCANPLKFTHTAKVLKIIVRVNIKMCR